MNVVSIIMTKTNMAHTTNNISIPKIYNHAKNTKNAKNTKIYRERGPLLDIKEKYIIRYFKKYPYKFFHCARFLVFSLR